MEIPQHLVNAFEGFSPEDLESIRETAQALYRVNVHTTDPNILNAAIVVVRAAVSDQIPKGMKHAANHYDTWYIHALEDLKANEPS